MQTGYSSEYVSGLDKTIEKLKEENKELKKEVEFLKLQRETLEGQLQHYRGYN